MLFRFVILLAIVCASFGHAETGPFKSTDLRRQILARGICLLMMSREGLTLKLSQNEIDAETITTEQYERLNATDMTQRIGIPTKYFVEDTATKVQTLRPLYLHNNIEKLLVRSLLSRSARTPPTNQETEAVSVIDTHIQQIARDRSNDVRQIGEDNIRNLIGKTIGWDRSEIGAWLIRTKEGRSFTSFHSSRSFNSIDPTDMMRSLIELLERHNLDLNAVNSIEFFHNHPGVRKSAFLLSAQDESVSEAFRNLLDIKNGKHITHRFHAVASAEDGNVYVASLEPVR